MAVKSYCTITLTWWVLRKEHTFLGTWYAHNFTKKHIFMPPNFQLNFEEIIASLNHLGIICLGYVIIMKRNPIVSRENGRVFTSQKRQSVTMCFEAQLKQPPASLPLSLFTSPEDRGRCRRPGPKIRRWHWPGGRRRPRRCTIDCAPPSIAPPLGPRPWVRSSIPPLPPPPSRGGWRRRRVACDSLPPFEVIPITVWLPSIFPGDGGSIPDGRGGRRRVRPVRHCFCERFCYARSAKLACADFVTHTDIQK